MYFDQSVSQVAPILIRFLDAKSSKNKIKAQVHCDKEQANIQKYLVKGPLTKIFDKHIYISIIYHLHSIVHMTCDV